MFTAEIEGLSEITASFGKAVNLVHQGVSRGVIHGVKEGATEARQKHTFKNRSHALEQSIEGVPFGWVNGGSRFDGIIRATAKHASWVEYPTRPHVITVRYAKWLHWEEPQGDHHFAKRVNHPGTKGQPFMHLAYFKAERVIIREIEIGIAQAQSVLA
jgi:hypothetical protein